MVCPINKLKRVADIEKSYQQLGKAGLKDSADCLRPKVCHTRQDPRCRLCNCAPETLQHITADCKIQAGRAYMERHNNVAAIVSRNICDKYTRLAAPGSKWETPQKVENVKAKILWDQIQTNPTQLWWRTIRRRQR